MKAAGLRCRGCKINHSISAINVQHGTDRTQSVGGIKITISIYRMLGSPFRFGISFFSKFNATAVGIFSVIEFHMSKIVLVSALAVKQLSK